MSNINANGAGGMADVIKMQLFMGNGNEGETFAKLKSFMMLTLFDVLLGIAKQFHPNGNPKV